ncbi:hypothetical protein GCM10020331_010520 [Ectobacillus funiculus]
MHVGMIPITTDGRLAAKQFFGKRTELQQLQDKFHEHVMEKKGSAWNVESPVTGSTLLLNA